MNDEQITKFMEDPQHMWWTEPMTLTLGKTLVKGEVIGEVFQGITPAMQMSATIECARESINHVDPPPLARMTLSGPWGFYESFKSKECVHVPSLKLPEIAIKAGTTLLVPLAIAHAYRKAVDVVIEVSVPAGWKVSNGQGTFRLPEEDRTDLLVEIATPDLNREELQKLGAQGVVVRASAGGRSIGEARLRVALKASALPQ